MTAPAHADLADGARVFDDALRFQVPSRSEPDEHLVDLGAYRGAGRCDCMDFATRFEPLIARGVSPEDAVARGLVKLRDYQLGPEDALSCWHLVQGRRRVARHFIAAALAAREATAEKGA